MALLQLRKCGTVISTLPVVSKLGLPFEGFVAPLLIAHNLLRNGMCTQGMDMRALHRAANTRQQQSSYHDRRRKAESNRCAWLVTIT